MLSPTRQILIQRGFLLNPRRPGKIQSIFGEYTPVVAKAYDRGRGVRVCRDIPAVEVGTSKDNQGSLRGLGCFVFVDKKML